MTLSCSNRALTNPRRDGGLTRRALDHGEFVVGQSEVDGVAARVSGGGSSARSFVFHETDITVKQKTLASHELMLYDKYMIKDTVSIAAADLTIGNKFKTYAMADGNMTHTVNTVITNPVAHSAGRLVDFWVESNGKQRRIVTSPDRIEEVEAT